MRNGIIIPMLLVMAFFKVTHQKVYLSGTTCQHKDIKESIDSHGRDFSSVKPQQIFQFFKLEYFIPGVL